jgi:SulP family sulfate permease
MAENIPFIHTMCLSIHDALHTTHTVKEMLPTILVTICLSTIFNGVLFYIFGALKLGNVLHFFPRHVILGMTGGFGVFLILCAVESTTGIILADADFDSFISKLTFDRLEP